MINGRIDHSSLIELNWIYAIVQYHPVCVKLHTISHILPLVMHWRIYLWKFFNYILNFYTFCEAFRDASFKNYQKIKQYGSFKKASRNHIVFPKFTLLPFQIWEGHQRHSIPTHADWLTCSRPVGGHWSRIIFLGLLLCTSYLAFAGGENLYFSLETPIIWQQIFIFAHNNNRK
jgi:hypothetical protein